MSDDQQDDDAEQNYERTLEVDKARLLEQISNDHSDPDSGSDSAEHAQTTKMNSIQAPPAASEGDDHATIPIRIHGDIDGQETTNYTVPDELLEKISRQQEEIDADRWETMDIVLEEISESEIDESEVEDIEIDESGEPGFVLEKISDGAVGNFEGEISGMQTSPVLVRLEFDAVVREDGTLKIPASYLESGHVRPGMRFGIVAVETTDD